jgi:hypothetical protein
MRVVIADDAVLFREPSCSAHRPAADTGRLGVRVFPRLADAVSAYQERPQPDRPPA